jgi:hypothetical protein
MLGRQRDGAGTDEEAKLLFTSIQQAFANLRLGRPGKMPPPKADLQLDPMVANTASRRRFRAQSSAGPRR